MDASELEYQEEENQRKGLIVAVIFHTLILLLLIFYAFPLPSPPPGQPGVLISFGAIDEGMGDNNPNLLASASDDFEPEYEPETVEEPEVEPEPAEEPEAVEEPEMEETAVAKKQPKVLESDDKDALKLKKAEEDKKKKERDEKKAKAKKDAKKKSDAKKKADAKAKAEKAAAKKKADAKAKAKAEAKAAADAKAKAAADAKKQIGDLFGGGGDGKKPGNNGNNGSDPNPGNLDGLSSGTGVIGGGLGNRGGKGPVIDDSSQATGVVVIKVCVDDSGKVVSANYTQSGSTTTNSQLKKLAIANAKKYSFKRSDADKQCGTITYDFKVK